MHILITGAGRGLGRALASVAAAAGHRVSICSRSAPTAPLEVGIRHWTADVAVVDSVSSFICEAVRLHGPVDIFVNNAAVLGSKGRIEDAGADDVRATIDVNVTGAILAVASVLPYVRRPGGCLLHLSSYVGRVALPRYGAYAVSKFAIEGLARLVAAENPDLISVAIDPGMVETEMLAAALEGLPVSGLASPPTLPSDAAATLLALCGRLSLADSGTTLSLD
ncbi:MAG: SDR family oxidoreductase [Myxococcales bacterium]|nr:SDR family oxidoreductase [Myxococcales bacterium]